MTTKSDRRRNDRQPCLVPVEGKPGSVFSQTQTVDISKKGIGFISRRKIPLDKKIAIELDFITEPQSEPALVVGQVKWVSRLPKSPYYRVGMLLTEDLTSGSKTQLQEYLQKHS